MAWDDSDDDDWDKDDAQLTLPGAGKKDADEEVWSDEEGHDAHLKPDPAEEAAKAKAAAPPPAPPKPKTGLAKKIEEREKREQEEAERREALWNKLKEEQGSAAIEITDDMDEATKQKLLRKQHEEDADLDNAIDAFGMGEDKQEVRSRAPAVEAGAFENQELKGEKDFEKLAEMVQTKLAPHEGTKGHMACLKALLRAATNNMSTEDTKDLTNFMSVISNAKLAADRDKDKTKKNVKKAKGKFAAAAMNARNNDMDDIGMGGGSGWSGGGGGRDDDYDFM